MLRRRSVRSRILVLVLLPVLALVGLYAVVLDLTVGSYLGLRQAAITRHQLAWRISQVQRQLAAEQFDAALYIASGRNSVLVSLIAQERRTTAAIRSFTIASSSPGVLRGTSSAAREAVSAWRADLAGLPQLRAKVTSLSVTPADALTDYGTLISGGEQVAEQVITPLLDGPTAVQASHLLAMGSALQAAREETDLLRADLAAGSFPPSDQAYFIRLAVLRRQVWNSTLPGLDPSYQGYFDTLVPAGAVQRMAILESSIPSARRGLDQASVRAWIRVEGRYSAGFQAALARANATLSASILRQSRTIALRLILAGGAGLLAVIATITVAVIISRDLVRQLTALRDSAIDLTARRMPEIIGQLRAGEDVQPPPEDTDADPGADEVGQVHRAFNAIARTAVISAIDEIKIRRGVNDVFRNLARRNQSLLTRQLNLLDAMERRIHDPDELADLFRIDHLTTRMRRHAEGLLILAGGSSGRIWLDPVPVIDVMRAAVAEVEDYTRVRVTSRTSAALAGNAVADVIHLLAELVENATMFSPAHTQVRVDGDLVARGLSVEIEDRGLGMTDAQVEAANATIAGPPGFEQMGTEQLGLYIAGRLAGRHDIKITIRTSPYGGVTAIVLIPRGLVVTSQDDGHYSAGVRGLGGRPVPQITGGEVAPVGQETSQPGVGRPATSRAERLVAGRAERPSAGWPESAAAGPTGPAGASGAGGLPRRVTAAAGAGAPRPAAAAFSGPGSSPFTRPGSVLTGPGPAETAGVSVPADPIGDTGAAQSAAAPTSLDDLDGLPVRVPQANLAPQLRRVTAARTMPGPGAGPDMTDTRGAGPDTGAAAGPAHEVSVAPEAARNTMAALQRGWQRGRSAPAPAPEPRHAGPAGRGPAQGRPAVGRPSTDQPSTDQPSTDQPSTDQPSTDQPSTDQPSTDQPSTDRSAGERIDAAGRREGE
jgi:signal transduction histidine kinase